MKGSIRDQSKVLVPERIEHFNLLFSKDGEIQKKKPVHLLMLKAFQKSIYKKPFIKFC